MHRDVLKADDFYQIDHVDRNGLNNTKANLRLATASENVCNCRKPSNNKSGYIGVFWSTSQGKWRATIKINQKLINLGSSSNPQDLARLRDMAALLLHGEFASLNFPHLKRLLTLS